MKGFIQLKAICLFFLLTSFQPSIVILSQSSVNSTDTSIRDEIDGNITIHYFDAGNLSSELNGRYSIGIWGNDELINFANEAGLKGDGSSSNPFIIENYFITNFNVADLTLNIIIRNNLIGQFVYYGNNLIIENNAFDDAGPMKVFGNYNTIRNNQVTQGVTHSIYIEGDYNLVKANTLIKTGTGLTVIGSNNIVTDNFVAQSVSYEDIPLEPENSYGNNNGISVDGSNNFISHNTFVHSDGYGVYIANDGNNNIITENNFINNSLNVQKGSRIISQAYEHQSLGYDSDFVSTNSYDYNYWKNATGFDENEDGIIDSTYDIGGVSTNDNFPLAHYVNISLPASIPPHGNYFGDDQVVDGSNYDIDSVSTFDNVFEGLPAAPVVFQPDLDEDLVLPDLIYVIPIVLLMGILVYKSRKYLRYIL
ncbi:MAG: right-handed parallel beta-helix repeat-containing protein [Candidatus Kariarchaeaceae archaeon]